MKKNKKSITVLLFVVIFLTITKTHKAQAGYWGEGWGVWAAEIAWTEAKEAFKGAMLKSLKQQANNLLRDRIRVLLTGDGSSLVITDYEEFIFNNSREEGVTETRDFFRSLESGVGSETASMHKKVEENVINENKHKSTIDQYVQGGVGNVFEKDKGGGIQALMAVGTNPMNSSFGLSIIARDVLRKETEEAQKKAEIEAVAGLGFAGKRDSENNLINLPGSVLSAITAKTETTYMDMVNMAEYIPEVVGSLAASMLSETIESGVVDVSKPIDNQVRSFEEDGDSIETIQDSVYGGFGSFN